MTHRRVGILFGPQPSRPGQRELHVARRLREECDFDDALFTYSGNVVFADMQAARRFAEALNEYRRTADHPERAVRASDLNAMGLLDEIMHHMLAVYRAETDPDVLANARKAVSEVVGEQELEELLRRFNEQFPPRAVYRGEQSVDEYLDEVAEGISGRDRSIEELLMLWLENQNPAYRAYQELFDEAELARGTAYPRAMEVLAEFLRSRPGFGERPEESRSLLDVLTEPMRTYPDSLQGQLNHVRTRWSRFIGNYLFRVLRSADSIEEERKAHFGGPGPTQVYEYGEDEGHARYSPDRDWMPNVVMIAKSTLVWLDQLSKQYGVELRRLDSIPDAELDRLARAGFNALWLIGIWRRSSASKRIKQLCGNPEAEASAYSLLEYEVSEELGGWPALEELRRRCMARGIRLASDMVPNHTGLDSTWVYEHPDWFIQLDHPPFPGYSFEGENLSQNSRVGIHIEDHYYSRSDAAVVFKRVDHETGDTRYIYHGNDGTGMPWNDTAQLDYLNAETREAVIQTIIHVARNFPIIRFDAAMTLAKRHYQRLWYPEPGSGGDIPSRAEHGLTREEFNRAMPQEFWREVVDRVAEEVPDTLLLAEAFWMMEGYFVRSLGMHRVYNSAFMNMLKNEENAKYRQTIKNTLEFDKHILKRFVNFMNNPDEETAVAQFGKGDKYFGVCTLMVTMPGLPMFGHGQLEGYEEKYGMEYSRAYMDEQPDRELIARHEREIFPLMKRRYLFSGVDAFYLYDMYGEDGRVRENVFAYSNAMGEERAVVLFNNAFERTWGWISQSVAYVEDDGSGHSRSARTHLGEALGLHHDYRYYCVFREHRSGLWFIRNSGELWDNGLFVLLSGYESQVFLDVYEVMDSEYAYYARLADNLQGAGVSSIDRALKELYLRPLHEAYAIVANTAVSHEILEAFEDHREEETLEIETVASSYRRFLTSTEQFTEVRGNTEAASRQFRQLLSAGVELKHLGLLQSGKNYREAVGYFTRGLGERRGRLEALVAYVLAKPLERLTRPLPEELSDTESTATRQPGSGELRGTGAQSQGETGRTRAATSRRSHEEHERGGLSASSLVRDWMLAERLGEVLRPYYEPTEDTEARKLRLDVLLDCDDWFERMRHYGESSYQALERLLSASEVRSYLGVNRYEGVEWFRKERFETLLYWLYTVALLRLRAARLADAEVARWILVLHRSILGWQEAERASGYRLGELRSAVESEPVDPQIDQA